jgi:hypothetical protein
MADQPQESASGDRERSTIQFPYSDLDDAAVLAKAIFNQGGGTGALDQVAAWVGHDAINSGAFRSKLNSARIFGLITIERGQVAVTAIGRRIADPEREKAARADAFLEVPLYRKLHEKHQGGKLPDPKGLETDIAGLGVAPKQVVRARQTFQRSAEQAGFFVHGKDRLVRPSTNGGSKEPPPKVPPVRPGVEPPSAGGSLNPFILGLLQTLPEPGAEWPTTGRREWLQTAAHIFRLIYKRPSSDDDPKGAPTEQIDV